MPELSVEFADLMSQVRAGRPEAVRQVFDQYSDHIRRIVRRKLHQRLRTQYDSIDFLQAVWASFFTRPAADFTFETPDALVNFLANIAHNKVVEVFRQRMQTRRHDLNRELPLHAAEPNRLAPQFAASQPSPSQYAIAEERWERLLEGKPPQHRQILELLRQGHTHKEVADQLALHPKTIQRLVKQLQEDLES